LVHCALAVEFLYERGEGRGVAVGQEQLEVLQLPCDLRRHQRDLSGIAVVLVYFEHELPRVHQADGFFDHTGVWKSSDEINQHDACAFGFARLSSQFSNVCMFLRR